MFQLTVLSSNYADSCVNKLWFLFSGIPVDTLVDIDGSYDRFSSLPYFRPSEFTQQDDDPFELCSMQHKHSKQGRQGIDLGLELGLALEKSIKLRSQSQNQDSSLSAGG